MVNILEYELKFEIYDQTNPPAKKPCMFSFTLFLSGKSC
jgi:hypothetical protein